MTMGIDSGERKETQGHVPMGNDGGQATAAPGDQKHPSGVGNEQRANGEIAEIEMPVV